LSAATFVSVPAAATTTLRLSVFPNPLAGEAHLAFDLSRSADVTLEFFDVSGRLVASRHEGAMGPGLHETHWPITGSLGGARLTAGVYFLELRAGLERRRVRVVVID
jgi:hypothetical protein